MKPFSLVLSVTLATLLLGCSPAKSPQAMSSKNDLSASTSKTVSQVQWQSPKPVDQSARNVVAEAYDATKKKQLDKLPLMFEAAKDDHELSAYPEFWYYRDSLSKTNWSIPTEEIKAYIKEHENTYVGERIKASLAIAAAKKGDFDTVRQLGPIKVNLSQAHCAIEQAKVIDGKKVNTSQILDNFQAGDSCWDLLSAMRSRGLIGLDQLRDPLRAAVEFDNKANAVRYAALVFTPTQLNEYRKILNNPKQWLASQQGTSQSPEQEELRTIAFSRLARQDRDKGIELLKNTKLITENNKQWAYTQFALVAILNHEQRADGWYRLAKNTPLSDYNAAWRVRAALYQPTIDWSWVKQSIELMNSKQQQETAWLYWKARALSALNNKTEAQQIYNQLSNEYDFYGLLAQEALGQSIKLPVQATPVSQAELNHIKKHPGLQKSIALFKLDARNEAVGEWVYAIQGLNDRELMAAAQWAEDEHFYDRTINTSLLTKDSVTFHQRYLAPFEGRVSAQAKRAGLKPSWVYGLIRQESRFVSVARSHVGASGLMQLMPGTAQLVAKKIGMDNFNPSMVNDFDTNTLLGTEYLKMTLDKVGNSELLATAGYNAGPNRAVRWRNNLTHSVEGAIFAETIPFTETRLYAKHVMSNAIWYELLFNGGQTSLVQRLGTIHP